MGYSVSFTGIDIDNILSKSQKFKSQNEDWVLIPSTITTLDISTLIRNGNYAFNGTLNLPEMDQLYGYNTTSKQEAKSLEGSCLIFVRNINRTIYQFISFYGIQDVTDQTIGIAWIHKVPKVFHLNESSNILFSYAENELNDKGIVKFDKQIRLFNDTGEFKYYDESEKSYKMLTGIISEMPKTIYGDLTDAFTKIDESLSTYSYVLDHINDDMIHVTSEEKEIYNTKYNGNLLHDDFNSIFPILDTLQSNVSNLITENETVINSAVSASTPISKELNMHTPGWNLIESVPGLIWYSVCYGEDKFLAAGLNPMNNTGSLIYSEDGSHWNDCVSDEGDLTTVPWTFVYYGNGLYFAGSSLKSLPGIFKSTDGIHWNFILIGDTSRDWNSICYGNDKFITVAYNSNYFAYSTDGINWTESTISDTSREWSSVCYGNDKFVAVADNTNYFAYSTDGIHWTEGTISSNSRSWYSVCYGNDKFVAVAYNSNYFAYSTNGINWTEGTISESYSFGGIVFCNNQFVSTGCENNNGFLIILYSTDAISWSISSTTYRQYISPSICYGNGKYITGIVNVNDFSSKILYSDNLISWNKTNESRNIDYDWSSVCYGNDKFVAVAENTNYFAYSTDGINWTEGTISGTKRYWWSVCYGNSKFVAVASSTNYFAYSTDGINWTERTISGTSRNWSSVCYGNDKYVAVVYNSNYFAYSMDGINWTEGTISNNNRNWQSVCYGNDKFVTVATSTIAYEYDYVIPDPEPARLTQIMEDEVISVCYGNDMFVAIGTGGTAAYSTDGTTWTQATISETSRNWSSVCYGNGKFVAICGSILIGQSSNAFAYSTDGINWTEGTISDTSRNWNSICYGNNKFVAVADSGYFAYSTDGITWTEGTITDTGEVMLAVCYGNDKFVVIGVNMNTANGYCAYSTDGINWTEGTISSNGVMWLSTCYGNDKFVVVGAISPDEPGYFAYSTDGINWTTGLLGGSGAFSVCYGNDKFVAVSGGLFGPSSIYYYSTDGINWSISNLKSSEKRWISSCYGNDKFIIVSLEGACTYLTNEDFVETVELLHPTTDDIDYWNNKAEKGHTHILDNRVKVDASDVIGNITIDQIPEEAKERMITLNSISDMLKLTKNDAHEGTWVFVTETNASKLFVVKSLTPWTEKTLPSSRQWYSVCYGNGKFVAIAYNSSYYAYSTNGINWTQGSIGYSRYWYSVCYGNGKFVAIARSTNYYAYSSNGTSWTRGTLPSSRLWYFVCYGNGKFVTITGNTKYFAYSTDGINWTESTISSTNREWQSICYGNGKFVAVTTNSNYFAYSTDGITWTEGTISNTSRKWYSICYGNDKFVTIAYNSNYFAYSTDGIHWTEGTLPSSRYWRSVCYGNDKFVAVANNTNYFAYSTDGINWTESTISDTSRSWWSVCYGNGKYVAVASGSNYFAYGNPCLSLDNFTQLTISPNITWGDLANKPTTFDELGITDSISNTEVDTLVSNLSTSATSAQTTIDSISAKYSILTDDLIANTHKIETDIDDSDQKLNILYDILNMPDEIVTTLKSLMT